MGHRLISALILLNALGLVLCVVLITAAIRSYDPARVAQISEAVKLCLHLFVAGAAPSHRGVGNFSVRVRSVTLEKEVV